MRTADNERTAQKLLTAVDDWKGHDPASFGKLLLDDVLIVTKNGVDREYRMYLFDKILLCCKEVAGDAVQSHRKASGGPGKSLLAKHPHPTTVQDSRKLPKLVVKGRIFMRNIVDVDPRSEVIPSGMFELSEPFSRLTSNSP